VADLGGPDVLTHNAQNEGDLLAGMLQYLGARVERLHALGVKDILLDPGFGFGKTLEDNYLLMRRLADLSVLELPLLVGVSRKSMIYRLLDITPQESLNGTTVLHTLALMQGAAVLRVHDVRQAVETIKITQRVCSNLE
jgi:dihydropteroate synthase